EGLLSTVPAVATAICGVFAGDWLTAPAHRREGSIRLWATGCTAVLLGLLWGQVFPINKNLWSSPFPLLSAGLAWMVLGTCHWLLDVKRLRGWETGFLAFGRNPLAGYFLSVALDAALTRLTVGGASVKASVYRHLFASWIAPCCGAEAASLLYAVAYVVL